MGLAASQARFLCLTARKADVELGISLRSMDKMSLTREMSELSSEYYSKLQAKTISYYHNGKYNKMNYNYLMGYGSNYTAIWNQDKQALKDNNSMILTDYNGRVVMSDAYSRAITSVLGPGAMDTNGRGGTFSTTEIPKILAALCPGFTPETFQQVIDEQGLTSAYDAHNVNTLTGEDTGENVVIDNSSTTTEKVKALIDFYYPIFSAAAANGWTSEYNKDMATNEDYVSDALVTGSFQLATVNEVGEYDEGNSLTYFITAGLVESRSDSDVREEITAWYNAEKEIISSKETYLDLQIDELSTELEAINTELQAIQSLIDDAVSSVFDWGSG
ncbi:MAG: hypothetical protein E7Z92_00565 [Cyanobacteria bacterium SIG31]|nr:hypothetical protein [Cyanobacteria bacterium SIG31]